MININLKRIRCVGLQAPNDFVIIYSARTFVTWDITC